MYRIILFGDTRPGLDALIGALAAEGHAVAREAPDADPAEALGRHRPHLALVDAVSSRDRTAPLCASLRRLTSRAAIPIVTIVDPAWLAASGLPDGTDDFLCEPVTADEVLVRVERAIWSAAAANGGDLIRVPPLTFDPGRHTASLNETPLDLTLREYDLLAFLAAHPGRVFSREALLDRVWGLDYLGGTRTVDVHVRRLRVKLDDEVGDLLETVRGVGYRLNASEDGRSAS